MKYQVKQSDNVPGAWIVYTKTGNVLVTADAGIAESAAFAWNALADGLSLVAERNPFSMDPDGYRYYTGPTL